MRKPDFSEVIEIVVKGERAHTNFLWLLSGGLIRAVGRPSTGTSNDGSYAKLEACSEELAQHGFEYSAHTLKEIRSTGGAFTPERRLSGVTFWAHHAAGNPDTLDAIAASAPRNQKLSVGYIQSCVRAMALARQQELEAESARRRDAYAKAQREREAAEADQRRATTAAERRAAAERADAAAKRAKANQQPPKRADLPVSKLKPEDVPLLIARASFARDLTQLRRSLSKLRETYEPLLRGFDEADLDNGHEELMAIAEAARTFAGILRKDNGKASHLSVVDTAS